MRDAVSTARAVIPNIFSTSALELNQRSSLSQGEMIDSALRDFKPVNKIRYNKHPRRKNNDLVAAMYAMYSTPGEDGRFRSIEAVRGYAERRRQAVYDMFRSRGYELRSKRLDGLQLLDGIRFTKTKGGYLRGHLMAEEF